MKSIDLFLDSELSEEKIKEETDFLKRCFPDRKIEYKYKWAYKRALKDPFRIPLYINFPIRKGFNDNRSVVSRDTFGLWIINLRKANLCDIEDAYKALEKDDKIFIASMNPRYSAYGDDYLHCKLFCEGANNESVMRKALCYLIKDCFTTDAKAGKTIITKYLLGQTFSKLKGETNA